MKSNEEEILKENEEQSTGEVTETGKTSADPVSDSSSGEDAQQQPQQEQIPGEQMPNEQPVEPSKDETIASLKRRLIQSEARNVAKEHGVTEKKLPYVVEMAKIGDIDPDSEDAAQLIRAAVEKVLDDIPELKMNLGVGTGSTGNFARRRAFDEGTAQSAQQEVAAAMRMSR